MTQADGHHLALANTHVRLGDQGMIEDSDQLID